MTEMAAVSVRVLTGEIWAEVTERLLLNRDKHDSVEFLNQFRLLL